MKQLCASFLFAVASLLPAICLVMGAWFAGPWPVLALLSITLLVFAMDRFGPVLDARGLAAARLPWLVGSAHFAALGATLWALGLSGHLDVGQKLALVVSMGLFAGQVTNACAHELIHRSDTASRSLGVALYVSLLNGQHVSSHLLVHHIHAGTAKDPNSAPVGQSFYRFALRASVAEFRGGWQAETSRHKWRARRLHPYAIYLTGGLLALALAAAIGGVTGAAMLVVISLHAQMQLLLSDYVQHYGLRRQIRPNGKPEPMGPHHSWNAPHPYSAALMLNAPRHSDHHMNPSRRFDALRLEPQNMPTLPYSIPVMGAAALIPPLWRRLMDHRARTWCAQPLAPTDAATAPLAPVLTN